jgi:hypothetical protein
MLISFNAFNLASQIVSENDIPKRMEVALSGQIMVSPAFGAATIGFLIGIALLLAGIQIVVAGISGRRKQMKLLDTRND